MKHSRIPEANAPKLADICFLCADGFPLDQLSVALDYLDKAGRLDPNQRLTFSIKSFTGGEVRSGCGIKVSTDRFNDLQLPCRHATGFVIASA